MTASLSRPDLLDNETIRFEQQFTPHMFLTHLKSTLVVTDRRVLVHHPHVIFGVIEHGYARREIPLRHVSLVSTGTATSTGQIVKAVAAAFIGLVLITSASGFGGAISAFAVLAALALFAVAVMFFLSAHANGVFVHSTGGGIIAARGSKRELAQIQQAGDEMGKLLFT